MGDFQGFIRFMASKVQGPFLVGPHMKDPKILVGSMLRSSCFGNYHAAQGRTLSSDEYLEQCLHDSRELSKAKRCCSNLGVYVC